jgi:hypothetical protein
VSTTYNGNPAATQAPSSPPAPGVSPELVLPADGDADNAASVAQAFKVLADFISWLTAPFAIALAWTQEIVAWRNARLQKIYGIDHFGFPRGRLVQWDENWKASLGYGCSGVTARQVGSWRQVITSAGGSIDSPGPGVGGVGGNPFGPIRAIRFFTDTGGSAVGQYVEQFIAQDSYDGYLDDDTVLSVDFDFVATDITHQSIMVGFAASGLDIDPTNAVFFRSDNSTANWQCVANSNPGSTSSDSGVAISATTIYRFRIVPVGANRSDDSTRRVLFFINDALVGNLTTNIPFGSGNQAYAPFMRGTTLLSGGTLPNMSMAIVSYRQTTAPAGVF